MSVERDKHIDGMEAVSRAYRDAGRSSALEPPAALDDAIRAAARRAVKSGPAPVGKSWLRRWTPQLAVAATVVLTVSMVFVGIQEQPGLVPAPVAEIANPPASPARVAAENLQKKMEQSADRRTELPAPNAAAQSSLPSVRQPAEPPAALPKETKEERADTVNAPAVPAAPVTVSPPAPAPAPAPIVADAARADAFSGPTPVPSPAAKEAAAGAAATHGIATGAVAAQKSLNAERARETVGARAFADAPPQSRAEKAEDEAPDPWIKRMTELRRQGKIKELHEELTRFSKRYPQMVLPKELMDLPAE